MISGYELIVENSDLVLNRLNETVPFPSEDLLNSLKKTLKDGRLDTLSKMPKEQIDMMKIIEVPKEAVREDVLGVLKVLELIGDRSDALYPASVKIKGYLNKNKVVLESALKDMAEELCS